MSGTFIVALFALFSLVCASHFSVIEITSFGHENLERLKSNLEENHSCEWWIEIGDKLLAYSNYPSSTKVLSTGDPIFIVSKAHIHYY